MQYWVYVLRRLLGGVITVWAVATTCFVILNSLPGDPSEMALGETATPEDRARFRATYHLDDPVLTRYKEFLADLALPARALGKSFRQKDSVAALIARAWPSTFELAWSAALVGWAIAIPLALRAASKPKSRTDAAVGVI